MVYATGNSCYAACAELRQAYERQLETPFLPGATFSVAEGIMQICLHSHGHRAQCATRLRQLGGTPPGTDFILWLKEKRPVPEW